MEKKVQRRKKLTQLIKDLALIETTKQNRVPAAISDYILEEYGLNRPSNVKDQPEEEKINFLVKLEDIMKEKYEGSKAKEENSASKVNLKQCFMKSCDSFSTAKSEHFQTTLRLNSLLHEIIQLKEKHSEQLKGKSLGKQGELELSEKKLHMIKLKILLKFYGEKNSFQAHFQLRDLLRERLKMLQLQCNNLADLVVKHNELKNNKTYIELFKIYKQLMKREMKIDYMIED